MAGLFMITDCTSGGADIAARLLAILASYVGWSFTPVAADAALPGLALFGHVNEANLTILSEATVMDARFLASRLAQVGQRDVMVFGCRPAGEGPTWHIGVEIALWSPAKTDWFGDLTLWTSRVRGFWLVPSPRVGIGDRPCFPLGRHDLRAEPPPWGDASEYLRGFQNAQRFVDKALEF
jgi:hypothetical protein